MLLYKAPYKNHGALGRTTKNFKEGANLNYGAMDDLFSMGLTPGSSKAEVAFRAMASGTVSSVVNMATMKVKGVLKEANKLTDVPMAPKLKMIEHKPGAIKNN